jgi:hypothetical protein
MCFISQAFQMVQAALNTVICSQIPSLKTLNMIKGQGNDRKKSPLKIVPSNSNRPAQVVTSILLSAPHQAKPNILYRCFESWNLMVEPPRD